MITKPNNTDFVHNKTAQLVAEYSTQISQTPQISYMTADHLGSPRTIPIRMILSSRES